VDYHRIYLNAKQHRDKIKFFAILGFMRLHRFYVGHKMGSEKEITVLNADLAHQLSNVFRLKADDQIIIFDGTGFEYVSQIISLNKKEVILRIIKAVDKSPEVGKENKVSLYMSLIKKGNFELAVEKCTELGVDEIHPIISERSEKKDINMERLNKIVKEASEQSGRVILPQIYPHLTLEMAVSQAKTQNEEWVVFHTTTPSSECHPSLEKEGKENIAIFVGPEGGWTKKEIELFKKNNFKICSLGQNILRAETAAIVGVSKLFN